MADIILVKWLKTFIDKPRNIYLVSKLLYCSPQGVKKCILNYIVFIFTGFGRGVIDPQFSNHVNFHGDAYIFDHSCWCDCTMSPSIKELIPSHSSIISSPSMKNIFVRLKSLSSFARTVVSVTIKCMMLPQPTSVPRLLIHQNVSMLAKPLGKRGQPLI